MSTISLSTPAWQHLENLAARLGLTVEQVLEQLSQRRDLLDHIAAALAVPVVPDPLPARLRPAEPITDEIAILLVSGNLIQTRLPHRHEAFVDVVIPLHYKWVGDAWTRRIEKYAEPVADRLVELGVRLLNAGFIVEAPSQEIAARIAVGDYRPEHENWVKRRTSGRYEGWFCIEWDRSGHDFFRPATLITGARCYPGAALVPASSYDEVLDFSDHHGFRLSDGALDLVAEARREHDAMILAAPAIQRPQPPAAQPPIPVDQPLTLTTTLHPDLTDAPF